MRRSRRNGQSRRTLSMAARSHSTSRTSWSRADARFSTRLNPPIDVPGLEAPDSEMKAFARMKYLVFQRTVFLLLAVASTAFFAVAMGFLIDTHPTAGPTSFVLTVIFWVAFWINGRRLSRL